MSRTRLDRLAIPLHRAKACRSAWPSRRLARVAIAAAISLGAAPVGAESLRTDATHPVAQPARVDARLSGGDMQSPRTDAQSPRTEPGATQPLTLYVGQAHVLIEPGVRRIAVGNGRVVQATALDDRQVLLIPEAPGQSTIHLWGRGGALRAYAVDVLPAEAGRALQEVQALLGSAPNVSVRAVGDKIIVEGDRLGDEQSARLAEIGKRIPQLVNLASKVAFDRMIGMDVRMVEIRREVLENIGVRWSPTAQGPSFGVVADAQRSAALQPGGAAAYGATPGGAGAGGIEIRPRIWPVATALGLATSFTSMINALVQTGDAVVLAEPKLSCRSGGSARFVAGGELPIPYSGSLGTSGVLFKEYGVKFDVSPVASDSGTISAKIATEISSINFDVAVRDVPGLTKRRAETEVSLREHETIVIAGLLAEDSSRQVDGVPGMSDVPVLGQLFRSRQFRERKTELVVLITPYFLADWRTATASPAAGATAGADSVEEARSGPQPASGATPAPGGLPRVGALPAAPAPPAAPVPPPRPRLPMAD